MRKPCYVICKISSRYLASVAAQTGLSLTVYLVETLKTGFLVTNLSPDVVLGVYVPFSFWCLGPKCKIESAPDRCLLSTFLL